MTKFAIGVDLGGTYTKLALIDTSGRISRRAKLSTTAYKTRGELVSAIVSEVKAVLEKTHLSPNALLGVGIGVPGLVDFDRGLVYTLTNVPGWKNTPLKGILEAKLKVPVLVDNDVNVMTLGECRFGAGKGAKNLVCITLGTGVGGGIMIDGRLYRGCTFSAGEVGHMPLKEEGLSCNCGGYGCLERYVGNRYIVEEIRGKIRGGSPTAIKGLVNGDLSAITPEVISKAALKGDRLSIDFWNTVGKRIGVTLAGIVNLLNPERIIIGGGVAEAGEPLFKSIRKTVHERALPVPKKAVKILKARLGNEAGVIGAAALFFNPKG
ncbi:MAG: hypothetical protein A3F87_02770 [Omnitrophica WOR_2 bacterium RIFCSPLOWO2_12_FULL_51_24]|nr:MAG: hypothetical protein A2879_05405 [Omnitrophica WOR_2 bacterium RIFCSPHIGHO2_01_FULL_49_10]OGX33047.1 MAG: hypothetical protein A3I43_00480 [Omnitrophica WOR_2 bacterium RIFCSPLOWO2_02_FULL_50_19]OGX41775.1 MAG: hypothetical protein A3F87_02770 [Omnitrophica WOR_2 bacterium RIFCSPLOWO2_12_FULL_51_24]